MQCVLSVKNLCKRYRGETVLDKVELEVKKGEILAILGPNGAGKTTLMEIMEGVRSADSGTVSVLGVNPVADAGKLRNRIGIQLQVSSLPHNMTVMEAITLFSLYHDVAPRIDLLKRVGLEGRDVLCYGTLSTGQQRRLVLALAMVSTPELLFLDEPTAGLDVQSRTALHELMDELKSNGTTIILATHDMAEAEKMGDRAVILVKGRIVTTGTPREITAMGDQRSRITLATEKQLFTGNTPMFPCCSAPDIQATCAIFYSTDPAASIPAILTHVKDQGDRLVDLRVERPTLEERFLEITTQGGQS
jgi:ABC-2 type transport system ATP-binding protein